MAASARRSFACTAVSRAAAQVQISVKPHSHGRKVVTLTVEDEKKLNILSRSTLEDLVEAVKEADAQNPNVIVITGAGDRAFAVGANIKEMAAIQGPDEAEAFIRRLQKVGDTIRKADSVVIARVNGICLGGALEVAASADLRIASDNATFAMPEVHLAIPSVIESALLPGLIGWGKARRLLFLGERISAEEALKWNLIEKVAPQAQLDEALDEWLELLCRSPRETLKTQKRLHSYWERHDVDENIEESIRVFRTAFTKQEGEQESMASSGMRRFLEANQRKAK
ncbi:enoyl-CoA hydratase [Pterulicium gracile]|uniref:Enoyl-CoA hydratase n=1 Tax=Pterulicium gracile TaxID=1884261 RepID=A0A5C3QC77_9AGAR|nr:enoyl-CoA hydratase [Pterula gracilis]